MNATQVFSMVMQLVHAEGILYTVAGAVAGALGKNAFQKEAERRKKALEVQLTDIQEKRYDELNKMLKENSDRVARAEALTEQLERKVREIDELNSIIGRRLHEATIRCDQLERALVRYGHPIPIALHVNPGL